MRPTVLQVAAVDSCILTTRVTIDVLRRYDVRCRPLAVKLLAMNAEWAKREKSGEEPTEAWKQQGAWCVGMGYGAPDHKPEGGFDGHVVTIAEEALLMDLSLDQASRPEHGMRLKPAVFALEPAFFLGQAQVWRNDDAHLAYYPMPDNKRFLQAKDWRQRDITKAIVREVVAKIGRR